MTAAVRLTDVVPPPPSEGWPNPISFEVPVGAFALVVTSPGVATALIRLLAGLRQPGGGRVEVLGMEPGSLGRWETQRFRRRLGVGFDDPSGLVSNLSLRMNLVVPMIYSGLHDAPTAHRLANEILATMEMERWAERRPADLPPEIRREAVIARAIVRDPELLVLEEPTAGVRDWRADWLMTQCRERAATVLLTSTEREGVQYQHADTVIAIDTSGTEIEYHEVGVF